MEVKHMHICVRGVRMPLRTCMHELVCVSTCVCMKNFPQLLKRGEKTTSDWPSGIKPN